MHAEFEAPVQETSLEIKVSKPTTSLDLQIQRFTNNQWYHFFIIRLNMCMKSVKK